MPQQRKRNGEPTVRQDKLSKQNVILYLCGIIPVVWLGLLIAPCLRMDCLDWFSSSDR